MGSQPARICDCRRVHWPRWCSRRWCCPWTHPRSRNTNLWELGANLARKANWLILNLESKVVTPDDCSIAQVSGKATDKDDFEHHYCLGADWYWVPLPLFLKRQCQFFIWAFRTCTQDSDLEFYIQKIVQFNPSTSIEWLQTLGCKIHTWKSKCVSQVFMTSCLTSVINVSSLRKSPSLSSFPDKSC